MFACERKIIGASVPDVEQALTEQYGRSFMYERGRSQGSVSYLIRVASRTSALATIFPNPNGVTLRISPYIGRLAGVIFVIFFLIGLFLFILPGLLIMLLLLFRIWLTGKIIGRHIDNIARGAEHQARLRRPVAAPPPPIP